MGGGGVSSPAPVTLQESIGDVSNTANQVYGTEAQYQPQYQQLSDYLSAVNMRQTGANMTGYATPEAGNLTAQQYNQQSQLYNQFAPQAAASTLAANPLIGQQINASNSMIQQGQQNSALGNAMVQTGAGQNLSAMNMNNVINSNPLLAGMNSTANNEIASGGNVTPQEMAQVDQSTGSAYAANGLFNSGSSSAADLLNRDQFSQNRLQQWMGIGNQVAGANVGQQQSLLSGANNLMTQGNSASQVGAVGQNFGLSNLGGSEGELQQGINQLVNPNQMNANLSSLTSAFTPGTVTPQIVPQLLGTSANLNEANSQGAFAASSANAQLSNQQNAAMMQMGTTAAVSSATIASSFACWVAREVYGEDNPKWMHFREWMLYRSPRLFRNIYLKYGERFAKFLKGKGWLKAIIRPLMDLAIE